MRIIPPLLAFLLGMTAALPALQAATFPERPVRIVVPYAAGGFTDVLARLVSTKLAERLGQPVLVENKPGASTMLGAEIVARAPADGHTLLMATTSTLSTAPLLFRKIPFKVSDFRPVALTGLTPFVLVAHPSVPANDVKSLIALAKANPGKLNFATLGVGSSNHLVDEMFRSAAHVDIRDVPYKGGGPAANDLLAGHVELNFDAIGTALPRIQGGQLKGIGITSETRLAVAPNLPTFKESGLPQMVAYSWYGLLAPSQTPTIIVEQLNRVVNEILQLPEVRSQLEASGGNAPQLTIRQFEELIAEHTRTWEKIIKPLNIQLD
ncbi:MAG: tripartite tricarboxylate transporter substrate binding protein [Rhodocyclaceae bacterium]|nr:tripartite tricarboxylate transporter substrate binding protein [Rhodocyclaceae bacterium]